MFDFVAPDIFLQPSKVDYESGSETEKEIIQSHHKEEKIPLVTADQDKGGKSKWHSVNHHQQTHGCTYIFHRYY